MADYFTKFSFVIENLQDGERAWLADLLAGTGDHPTDDLAEMLPNPPFVGFAWSFEDDGSLWLHSDESGVPEDAAAVAQEFLARFRPHASVGFEWANTCSKPGLDAFGGGAVVITAGQQRWLSSAQWLVEQQRRPRTGDDAMSLRDALIHVAHRGFATNADADSTIRAAACGLLGLYDAHGLHDESASSAADQCADLYDLLCRLGLPVA